MPGIHRGREDHERNVTQGHAKLARERGSVDAGHLHVEYDDRGRVVLHEPQRLRAISSLEDAEPVVGQELVLRRADVIVVVDDQDRTRCLAHIKEESKRRTVEPIKRLARPLSVRVLAALALLLSACGGTAGASPTPAPSPLPQAELKYRVMDAAGRIWFCDPDFYPLARADEGDLAKAKIDDIKKDGDTYAAIAKRTGTDTLAVYRDWKALNALVLQPVNDAFAFAYLAQRSDKNGERVDGRVTISGSVLVLSRAPSGAPNCPICLARDTRIATPFGDVAVDQLRVGDVVWTQDERGERVASPLAAIGSTPVPPTHQVVRIVLGDGRTVLVSPGHPTADGRHVGDIRAGDELDGARVVSAERQPYDGGLTFDVRPAGASGAYWANGVLLISTLP